MKMAIAIPTKTFLCFIIVFVGIAIAIFIILLLYWLLVAEDMKPWLSAMVPSVAQQFIV